MGSDIRSGWVVEHKAVFVGLLYAKEHTHCSLKYVIKSNDYLYRIGTMVFTDQVCVLCRTHPPTTLLDIIGVLLLVLVFSNFKTNAL